MDVLDRDLLLELAGHQGWPSVSFFLPMHRLPRETAEDRLRLKNLVRNACEQLVKSGMRDTEADAACSPVRDLLEDDAFWRETAEGMALFVSPDETRALKVDISLPEQVTVGDRYYLRPLMNAHRIDERFWALALDKNGSRLFRGDRSAIEQVDLKDTPLSFEEAMKYEDAERNLTQHSFASGRVSSRGRQHEGSNYAGYGGAKDVDVEQTTRFARLVERGVTEAIGEGTTPLLLFGNERLLAAYREVNRYPSLAKQQVTGSSDYLSAAQIQSTALEQLSSEFALQISAELDELTNLEGSSLTSHDPTEIVAAAASGRVKTLFFDESVGPFGVFDRESFEVDVVCAQSPRYLRESKDPQYLPGDTDCGWDLVDLAAAETALHGGEVRAFTGENPPVQGVAAVYRY